MDSILSCIGFGCTGCIGFIKKKIVSGFCSEDLVTVFFLLAVATKPCINSIAVVVTILSYGKNHRKTCFDQLIKKQLEGL